METTQKSQSVALWNSLSRCVHFETIDGCRPKFI